MRPKSAISRASEAAAWLAGALLVLAGPAAAAALPQPPALNPAQQRMLQRIACGPVVTGQGIEVEAAQLAGKGATPRATVRCPLARRVLEFPTFYQRDCVRSGARQWRCDAPVPGVYLPKGATQVPVTYRQDNTAVETAAEVADLIGRKYGYTFNGRNLALIVRGACHVSNNGPGIAPGMINYLLLCGDDGVVVTKACQQQRCRLFPSALYDPKRAEFYKSSPGE